MHLILVLGLFSKKCSTALALTSRAPSREGSVRLDSLSSIWLENVALFRTLVFKRRFLRVWVSRTFCAYLTLIPCMISTQFHAGFLSGQSKPGDGNGDGISW